ncbi:MAG: hypothetical protein ABWY08_07340 [Comamonas sp.]
MAEPQVEWNPAIIRQTRIVLNKAGGDCPIGKKAKGQKKARSKTGLERIQETGVSRGSKETTVGSDLHLNNEVYYAGIP